ncbi:isochorismatase family protein [Nocardiopsis sp. LDBS1602]|uniref:isochorismatase family protein n=1 Tax=Nocardiopsis sp. LDBS1602 TaxID=3109597 RepID=UPI002DBA12EB|nr:isochorismatase family protein [Nocardiopsis sp. LDBS1602]MEC3893222.1 isochorismatase family protein [Nocardiopsis sp. LDBS1602]
MTHALLIIDMHTFLVEGLWRGEDLARRLGALASRAREVGVPVLVPHQVGPPGDPFDPDLPGREVSPLVGIGPEDRIVPKRATDSFWETGLADHLRSLGTDTVVVTGAATDYCVDTTVRSATSHGFAVELVSDGHAPMADGDPEAGIAPERIIAHHNSVLSQAIHPGGATRLVAADEALR